MADVHRRWDELAQAGIDTTSLLANGLNHPIPAAHLIPAELIMQCIEPDVSLTPLEQLISILQADNG